MKKARKWINGSISTRMFALLISCILLVPLSFIVASVYKDKYLENLTFETYNKQIGSITEFSEDMIKRMITQEMNRSTELEAKASRR